MKITFEFDVDETEAAFTLSAREMIFVWNYILDQTSIQETIKNCLLPMWLIAARNGDNRGTKTALSPLASATWKWPAYDVWRRRFKSDGILPSRWRQIEQEAQKWPHSWNAMRMLILDQTLHSAIFARREFLQWQLPRRAKSEWEFRKYGCSVELSIAQEFANDLVIPDWSTWPPFFPGDTNIVALKLEATQRFFRGQDT